MLWLSSVGILSRRLSDTKSCSLSLLMVLKKEKLLDVMLMIGDIPKGYVAATAVMATGWEYLLD